MKAYCAKPMGMSFMGGKGGKCGLLKEKQLNDLPTGLLWEAGMNYKFDKQDCLPVSILKPPPPAR